MITRRLKFVGFALLVTTFVVPLQAHAQSDTDEQESVRGTYKVRTRAFNPFRASRMSRFSSSRFGFPRFSRFQSRFDRSQDESTTGDVPTDEPVVTETPVAASAATASSVVTPAAATSPAVEPESTSVPTDNFISSGSYTSSVVIEAPIAASSSGRPPYRPPVRSPYRPPPRPPF